MSCASRSSTIAGTRAVFRHGDNSDSHFVEKVLDQSIRGPGEALSSAKLDEVQDLGSSIFEVVSEFTGSAVSAGSYAGWLHDP